MTSASEKPVATKHLVVAHVVKTLSVGGVQRVLLEILKHTDTARFRPIVLCMERRGEWGEELAADGMQVDLFGREYPWRHVLSHKMLGLWPLVRWLRANRVDVLHIHMPKAALFLILAGKLAGVPCIVLHHHALYRDHHWASLGPLRLWMENRVTRLADALIAVSETVSACTRETFGLSPERITVIPNAGISQNPDTAPQLAAPCPEVPAGAKVVAWSDARSRTNVSRISSTPRRACWPASPTPSSGSSAMKPATSPSGLNSRNRPGDSASKKTSISSVSATTYPPF
jgi:hypothetical protein